jgi:hypothetical protein
MLSQYDLESDLQSARVSTVENNDNPSSERILSPQPIQATKVSSTVASTTLMEQTLDSVLGLTSASLELTKSNSTPSLNPHSYHNLSPNRVINRSLFQQTDNILTQQTQHQTSYVDTNLSMNPNQSIRPMKTAIDDVVPQTVDRNERLSPLRNDFSRFQTQNISVKSSFSKAFEGDSDSMNSSDKYVKVTVIHHTRLCRH